MKLQNVIGKTKVTDWTNTFPIHFWKKRFHLFLLKFLILNKLLLLFTGGLRLYLSISAGFLRTEVFQQTIEYRQHLLWGWNFPHVALSHFFKHQQEKISMKLLSEGKLSLTSNSICSSLWRISVIYSGAHRTLTVMIKTKSLIRAIRHIYKLHRMKLQSGSCKGILKTGNCLEKGQA